MIIASDAFLTQFDFYLEMLLSSTFQKLLMFIFLPSITLIQIN